MADLMTHLRTYLAAEEVTRDPQVAGDPPPLFLAPEKGAWFPGDLEGVEDDSECIVSAFLSGGLPSRPYESMLRKRTVDFWIRCTKAPMAWQVDAGLYEALADKRAWDCAGLEVIESLPWREMAPLSGSAPGFTFITSYVFELRA